MSNVILFDCVHQLVAIIIRTILITKIVIIIVITIITRKISIKSLAVLKYRFSIQQGITNRLMVGDKFKSW